MTTDADGASVTDQRGGEADGPPGTGLEGAMPPSLPPDASPPQPATAPPPVAPSQPVEHVTPTRISASWTAVVVAVVLLVLLVIFIAGNTQRATVNFLGFHGHAPTAVMLLIAVIAGAVIVIIVGAARILQLRSVARHSKPSRGRRSRRTAPPTPVHD